MAISTIYDPIFVGNSDQKAEFLQQLGITPADLTSAGEPLEGGEILIPTFHSSNVESIGYNKHTKRLVVLFQRKKDRPESTPRIYIYTDVEDELFDELFSAGSPGHEVWERLRRAGVSYSRAG